MSVRPKVVQIEMESRMTGPGAGGREGKGITIYWVQIFSLGKREKFYRWRVVIVP